MGSPRPNGNTAELCKPFMDELRQHNAEVDYITLHDKNIAPVGVANQKAAYHLLIRRSFLRYKRVA